MQVWRWCDLCLRVCVLYVLGTDCNKGALSEAPGIPQCRLDDAVRLTVDVGRRLVHHHNLFEVPRSMRQQTVSRN